MTFKTHLIIVVGLDFDRDFIPHLDAWYTPRVDTTHLVLHSREPTDYVPPWSGPHTVDRWVGVFLSGTKVYHTEQARQRYVAPEDLYVVVDADEFVECDDFPRFREVQGEGQPVCYGRMIDRFAGKVDVLAELRPEPSIFEQFPVVRDGYSQRTYGSILSKSVLLEGRIVYKGIHSNKTYPLRRYRRRGGQMMRLHHFKWTASREPKARQRMRDWKGVPGHGHRRISVAILRRLDRAGKLHGGG